MNNWKIAKQHEHYTHEMQRLSQQTRLAQLAQGHRPNQRGLFIAATITFLTVLVWFVL